MVATATSLPAAVLYLVLLFADVIGAGGDFTVDYLQDGLPEYTISVRQFGPEDDSVVAIRARSVSDDSVSTYRAEPSRLAGRTFLVTTPDSSLPMLLDLAPLLGPLSGMDSRDDAVIPVPGDAALASGDAELDLGSTLVFLTRSSLTAISAPEAGIVLLVSED